MSEQDDNQSVAQADEAKPAVEQSTAQVDETKQVDEIATDEAERPEPQTGVIQGHTLQTLHERLLAAEQQIAALTMKFKQLHL